MLDATSWAAIRLSIELAGATTASLLVLGTPLAWWLARGHSAAWAWLRLPLLGNWLAGAGFPEAVVTARGLAPLVGRESA